MRKIILTLALLALLSAAQARFYLGFPTSGIYASDALGAVGGVHFGTYNLDDDFGIRATAEFGIRPNTESGVVPPLPLEVLVEGGVDGTYSFGEGVVFYTGAGLGYGTADGSGSPFVSAFVGLDFDAGSVVSIFLEINPRYAFSNTGLLHVRSGINFHIGDPDDNPVSEPDAGLPWLEPVDSSDSGLDR
jgi:hypothetical protein